MIAPFSAADYKGLLKAAIRDPNPVIFLENEMLYGHTGEVPKLDDYVIPIGKARIVRSGGTSPSISWSNGMSYALKAADELAKEGIEAEVIDLRTLRPMDTDTIIASVKKTGRAVTVEEGWQQSRRRRRDRRPHHGARLRLSRCAGGAGVRQGRADALCGEPGKARIAQCGRGGRRRQSRFLSVRSMAGPNEQPLPPDVIGREDATEVLRAFVVDGGLSIAFQRAFEEPDMWGLLLVDIARHAARAYARESGYTEDEALARIVEMFEAEINRPTDVGNTTPRSQQGH